MILAARPILKTIPLVEGVAEVMIAMIADGHLVFIAPDRFALTTTGMLLGPPAEMPQG